MKAGFIGLGAMGAPMAVNLAKKGLLAAVVAQLDSEADSRLDAISADASDPWTGFQQRCTAYLQMAQEPEIQQILLLDAPAAAVEPVPVVAAFVPPTAHTDQRVGFPVGEHPIAKAHHRPQPRRQTPVVRAAPRPTAQPPAPAGRRWGRWGSWLQPLLQQGQRQGQPHQAGVGRHQHARPSQQGGRHAPDEVGTLLLGTAREAEARQALAQAFEAANGGVLQPFEWLLRERPDWLREQLAHCPNAALRQSLMERLPAGVSRVIESAAGNETLSARERAVLQLIARGCSNQEISDQLFISLHTVKTHASHINSKLGVERRTQAVARAKELGLLV